MPLFTFKRKERNPIVADNQLTKGLRLMVYERRDNLSPEPDDVLLLGRDRVCGPKKRHPQP